MSEDYRGPAVNRLGLSPYHRSPRNSMYRQRTMNYNNTTNNETLPPPLPFPLPPAPKSSSGMRLPLISSPKRKSGRSLIIDMKDMASTPVLPPKPTLARSRSEAPASPLVNLSSRNMQLSSPLSTSRIRPSLHLGVGGGRPRSKSFSVSVGGGGTVGGCSPQSNSALMNDIGVLMRRRGSMMDAVKRFEDAIATFEGKESSGRGGGGGGWMKREEGVVNGTTSAAEGDGLLWFHHKLAVEDSKVEFDVHPRRRQQEKGSNSSAYSFSFMPSSVSQTASSSCDERHHHHHSLGSDIASHIKILPCDSQTPLGFEYLSDPISIGSITTGGINTDLEDFVPSVSRLNLASMKYGLVRGDEENLKDVKILLEKVLQDVAKKDDDGGGGGKRRLGVIAKNNMGVVLFRMKKVKEAMEYFEAARLDLEEEEQLSRKKKNNMHRRNLRKDDDDDRTLLISMNSQDMNTHHFPPHEYLTLTTLTHLARLCINQNDTPRALSLSDEIIDRSQRFLRELFSQHHVKNHYSHSIQSRVKWMMSITRTYFKGLVHHRRKQYRQALTLYNEFVDLARRVLGHQHVFVGVGLRRKGDVLLEEQRLCGAMISYLACLKVWDVSLDDTTDRQGEFDDSHKKLLLPDIAHVTYSVARTLHDREEFRDALRMYQKALTLQQQIHNNNNNNNNKPSIQILTTLCNIARVHRMMGDIQAALKINQQVVLIAITLAGGNIHHPFVANQKKILGNVLVEAGRLEDAMEVFAEAARADPDGAIGGYEEAREARANAGLLEGSGLRLPDAAAA